jgi:hypothetical protein
LNTVHAIYRKRPRDATRAHEAVPCSLHRAEQNGNYFFLICLVWVSANATRLSTGTIRTSARPEDGVRKESHGVDRLTYIRDKSRHIESEGIVLYLPPSQSSASKTESLVLSRTYRYVEVFLLRKQLNQQFS